MPAKPPGGAGGTSANDIKAGGASFELSLKDELSGRLKAAQTGVKNFTESVKRYSAPLAGGLGQIFEVASRGGLLGAGIAIGQQAIMGLSDEIADLISNATTLNKEVERFGKLSAESLKIWERSFSAADARLLSESAPNRTAAITSEIARLERELSGVKIASKDAADEVDRLSGKAITDPDRFKLWAGGGLEASLKAATDRMSEADKAAEKLAGRLSKLRTDLATERDPVKRFGADISAMEAALNDAIGTFGMSADRAKLFRMEMAGVPEHILQTNRLLVDTLEYMTANAEKAKQQAESVKNLQDYVANELFAAKTAGLSPREIELLKAQRAGVPGDVLDQARRDLLGGGGVGQLLGRFLGALPDISTLTRGMRSTVAGGLGGGAGLQQFGYGSSLAKEQTDLLKWLVDGKGKLPDRIGQAVANGLVLR